MGLRAFILLSALFAAGGSLAQSVDATGQANSAAQNSLTFNGGAVSAPSFSGNNTAACVVSSGVGLGIVGLSIGASGGRVDKNCITLVEVEFVVKLLNMPNGPGRKAAIYHACRNNKRLRATLVEAGVCVIKR